MKLLTCIAAIVLVLTTGFAQSIDKNGFFTIGGGISSPTVTNYKVGPEVHVSLTKPFKRTVLGTIRADFSFPQHENSDVSIFNYSVFGEMSLPFAPEAASTFYVTAGAGVFQSRITYNSKTNTSDLAMGLRGGLGYLIVPESWSGVLIDLRAEYMNAFFAGDDWNELTITAGVGFFF
ncbi:MAG: hypothetical protein LWX56_01960 [Ignavibacteria bacterium]|nr:hypothetical protein [Ignavibacteria bacterium]